MQPRPIREALRVVDIRIKRAVYKIPATNRESGNTFPMLPRALGANSTRQPGAFALARSLLQGQAALNAGIFENGMFVW